jgi:hypothetical protein
MHLCKIEVNCAHMMAQEGGMDQSTDPSPDAAILDSILGDDSRWESSQPMIRSWGYLWIDQLGQILLSRTHVDTTSLIHVYLDVGQE